MEGYVYLICDPAADTYKIGRTKDVGRRLRQIQTGCSSELFVVKTHRTKYPVQLERMLHFRYGAKRQLNEWFRLDSDDIAGFEGMCEKLEGIIKCVETDYTVT